MLKTFKEEQSMSKEKRLTIVKENGFNKIINYFKSIFLKDKIQTQIIYENINILEQQLEGLKQQDVNNKMIQVSIKTIENRIALLNYRASLKKSRKKRKNILVK